MAIAGAIGLGCKALALHHWLKLVCYHKNGTGGHPIRATITPPLDNATSDAGAPDAGADDAVADDLDSSDADAGEQVLPDTHHELRVVLPYRAGVHHDVALEWSDTRYTLHVDGTHTKLQWAGAVLALREECADVAKRAAAMLRAARELPLGQISRAEARALPRFGVCQQAGLGSWTLGLTSVAGSGSGASRALRVGIELVWIDFDGHHWTAPLATWNVRPGGLKIPRLAAYDYDGDGHDEVIVPYQVTAHAGAAPAHFPAAIWSFKQGAIVPYAKAPAVHGGAVIKQLDYDMRPDIGSYGPFVAWLGPDCGLAKCPTRITGPLFFAHSLESGGFSTTDGAARSALAHACKEKPKAIVAMKGSAADAKRTAHNLVCARVHGVAASAITSELAAKQKALCGGATSCPLDAALHRWLDAAPPITLKADTKSHAQR